MEKNKIEIRIKCDFPSVELAVLWAMREIDLPRMEEITVTRIQDD